MQAKHLTQPSAHNQHVEELSEKSQLNDPTRWFQDLTFFPKRTSLRPGIPPASFLWVLPFPTVSLFLLRLGGLFLLKSWHFWSPAPPTAVGLLHRQQAMPYWPQLAALLAEGCGGSRGVGALSLQGTQHTRLGVFTLGLRHSVHTGEAPKSVLSVALHPGSAQTSCLISDKSSTLSQPQFPNLKSRHQC